MAVTIVQQASGFTTNVAGAFNAALPAAPGAGRLVIAGVSVNKAATSLSCAAPFTERQEYLGTGPQIHGALADAVASQTCVWTKGAAQNSGGQAAWGIYETSVLNATYRTSAKYPITANDVAVATLTGDLGTAPVAGVVFAIVGADSAFRENYIGGTSAWARESDVTWTNGFSTLAMVITDSTTGDIAGGATFVIGYKEVAAGGSTSTTVSWPVADQAFLVMSLYDTAPPTPAVSAGSDTTATVNVAFTTTATETNLTSVTARSWTVFSGPAQVGATLSTAAALSWTPTVAGVYVLRYSATHNGGAVVADDVQVSVSTPTRSLTQAWLGITAMTVKTSSSAGAEPVRIGFAPTSDMVGTVWSGSTVTPDANGISKHSIPALVPDSPYYYQVEVGGGMVASPQLFRTLPDASGPRSFSFAFSSCRDHAAALPDPNPTAFSDMLTRGIDFFLEIGDFHYRNISTNDQALFRAGYDEFFTRTNIANVLKSVPSGYVWDDHDFGGDGSNGSSVARPAAQAVYRERTPHPTLPSATGLIYHTFRVGRVRFIVLDCRSARSPVGNADNSSKTMLGAEQKTWLQNLLNNADTPMTVIVSSVGWIGAAGVDSGQDHWAYYTTERAEVGGWITANAAKTKCIFISGDAHMLAYDDGTNSVAGCPQYHAAALNQNTSTKGGPYSGGSRASNNAYGFMEVTDTGAQVALKYTGIYNGSTVWTTHTTTVNAPTNNSRFLLSAV